MLVVYGDEESLRNATKTLLQNYSTTIDRWYFHVTNIKEYGKKAKAKAKACRSQNNSLISNAPSFKQMEQIIKHIKVLCYLPFLKNTKFGRIILSHF